MTYMITYTHTHTYIYINFNVYVYIYVYDSVYHPQGGTYGIKSGTPGWTCRSWSVSWMAAHPSIHHLFLHDFMAKCDATYPKIQWYFFGLSSISRVYLPFSFHIFPYHLNLIDIFLGIVKLPMEKELFLKILMRSCSIPTNFSQLRVLHKTAPKKTFTRKM